MRSICFLCITNNNNTNNNKNQRRRATGRANSNSRSSNHPQHNYRHCKYNGVFQGLREKANSAHSTMWIVMRQALIVLIIDVIVGQMKSFFPIQSFGNPVSMMLSLCVPFLFFLCWCFSSSLFSLCSAEHVRYCMRLGELVRCVHMCEGVLHSNNILPKNI